MIVGVTLPKDSKIDSMEQLEELFLLCSTLGISVKETKLQNIRKIYPSTFISTAMAESYVNKAKMMDIGNIIINYDITPSQMKNLQNLAGNNIRILDRNGVIIDIFNIHAKSNESQKQVLLAKYEYILPRLTKQWSHLERQMGGTGTRGGPGEKQIEIDRRLIRKEIVKLKQDLKKINLSKKIQSKRRSSIFTISLAGYTNAGKSTIMNLLTGSKVYAKNELFATLDSTTRNLKLSTKDKAVVSDTVGFIQNLPHELIASFRTTLSDIKSSDYIIKVIDASYENFLMHIKTIEETMEGINASEIDSILLFNKIDLLSNDILKSLMNRYPTSIFISAKSKIGRDSLIAHIEDIVTSNHIIKTLDIPYKHKGIINEVYKNLDVLDIDNYDNFISVKVKGDTGKINHILRTINKDT